MRIVCDGGIRPGRRRRAAGRGRPFGRGRPVAGLRAVIIARVSTRLPLLLDVDTGIDDAVALVCACGANEIALVGVTCVAGNVGLERVVPNTRHVLALAGRAADVPVGVGASRPLSGAAPFRAAQAHGDSGLGHARVPASDVSGPWAPTLIVEAARRHAGRLVLVATGPLTNVALAMHEEPALPDLLDRLVFMGGAFRRPGNDTPTAEFNVAADPEAAHFVLTGFAERGHSPIAVGLDVTSRVLVSAADFARLPSGGDLHGLLAEALAYSFDHSRSRGGADTMVLHDPLALAVAIDPSLVVLEHVHVGIETGNGLTRGQTVVDWAGHWERDPNLHVALDVDPAVASGRILALLGRALTRR